MTDQTPAPDDDDWDEDDDEDNSVWAEPTLQVSEEFTQAFRFFNARLFDGRLPFPMITMRKQGKAPGYFSMGRFGPRDGSAERVDEIALNSIYFKDRTLEETLSTLVHEMCHQEQAHFGKPSRNGYHNKEWAEMMKSVGLAPSDTGQPGGKETGQRVIHYIAPGEPFEVACRALLDDHGFDLSFTDLWKDKERQKKAASKTKYTCPECGLNAWGKPEIHVVCGECNERMTDEGGTAT